MLKSKINKENADLNVQLAKQRLIVDVENAYANAEAAQKSFQAQELSLSSNEKAYALSKAKFENGVSNATEMTNARNRLDIARAQYIRARLDLVFKRNVIQFYMNQPIQLQP
jgi:outer membrane protein